MINMFEYCKNKLKTIKCYQKQKTWIFKKFPKPKEFGIKKSKMFKVLEKIVEIDRIIKIKLKEFLKIC